MKLNPQAIRALRKIMDERGVPPRTGEIISLTALPNTQAMVDWLKENPQASIAEMRARALEVGESDA